jgi:hypothetical protein
LRQEGVLKRQRVEAALRVWQSALDCLPAIGDLTGFWKHEPIRQACAPLIQALKDNLP